MHNQFAIMSSIEDAIIVNSDQEDPETDNDQHARKALFLNKSRRESHHRQPQSELSKLPSEILLLIFSHLTLKTDLVNLTLTCKQWANLVIDSIWFRPNIHSHQIVSKLANIMRQPVESTQWNYRKFIRRLNLSFVCNLINDDFVRLFESCNNLERITLVNCNYVGSATIARVIIGCSKLQSIDLTGVNKVEDVVLDSLSENCFRLQGIYAPGAEYLSGEAIARLFSRCCSLKRVKFNGCEEITDQHLYLLTSNCPNLVEADFHNCAQITDASVEKMFMDLLWLREFKVSFNYKISHRVFDSLTETLDKLRVVDLTGCTQVSDHTVDKLVKVAPKLRNLVLSKCTRITDTSLRTLSTLGKNLHYIHMGHCNNITDFGAITLIRNCHRLQYIDFACCTQLTNATLEEMANLQRLRRIGLVKCSNITDDGILALARSRRGVEDTLERVHLSYCSNLHLFPIYQLLRSCPRLTHLSLTGVTAFLRADITQYCRDPPSDFTPHQRALFCVFSGKNVAKLREHLKKIIQPPSRVLEQIAPILFESDFTPLIEEARQNGPNGINQLRQELQSRLTQGGFTTFGELFNSIRSNPNENPFPERDDLRESTEGLNDSDVEMIE